MKTPDFGKCEKPLQEQKTVLRPVLSKMTPSRELMFGYCRNWAKQAKTKQKEEPNLSSNYEKLQLLLVMVHQCSSFHTFWRAPVQKLKRFSTEFFHQISIIIITIIIMIKKRIQLHLN